ncbi:hypothetical protein RCC94_00200 [Exiguobacterium acetylicum]|uniref:hypothetical protein n=1 Tax=Exiguobacterium TaxID=33986 RepID=UPI00044681BF|nr:MULTISPECIES: hypothetical protein [Exiguobacterium]EZP62084.1 hypothetical protein BW42_01757 [Exiguobacterium sp. RIT341]KQS44580.1 hypothetical protein ASG02_00645 [Exiguobacterium sp. Leaf196]MDQ6465881.1 hypothetical protein [Exiguobacterium acetylicum]HAB34837.1 hypothetical protein [Exiguobacterium sp.]
MSKRPARNWVAFGATLTLVTFYGLKALRQGTKSDSSNGHQRRNSYSTIVTNVQDLTHEGKNLVETAKVSGMHFKEEVMQSVSEYQTEVQASLTKIQSLADEAKQEADQLSPQK